MCYLRVCPFTKAIGQDCTIEKKPDQCCPIITCPEGIFQSEIHTRYLTVIVWLRKTKRARECERNRANFSSLNSYVRLKQRRIISIARYKLNFHKYCLIPLSINNARFSCFVVPVKLLTSSTTSSPTPTTLTTDLGFHDNYGCTIHNSFYADGAQVRTINS